MPATSAPTWARLWSATGTRLAQVTFTGETSSGWQTATLSTPVPVSAGQQYVASYLAPTGHYSYTSGFFGPAWTSGDLTAPAAANGRYLYGAAGGFPTYSWGGANYFVDVVFERAAASMSVTGRTPSPGAVDVPSAAKPSLSVSTALKPGWSMTLQSGSTTVAGAAALSTDGKTLTFTPSGALAADTVHTVTVSGLTSTDGAVLPTQSWTFRTAPANTSSLFGTQVPSVPSADDSDAVELGTAFVPAVNGTITAVRFYKGQGNTGTHVGSVWAPNGTRLGTVTFADETASGWQTATFATPVPVTAGTTYVVSYYAPNGHYSATPQYFASPVVSGQLTGPSGNNGRYRYGVGGGLPTGSWNSTSYFVDVAFRS